MNEILKSGAGGASGRGGPTFAPLYRQTQALLLRSLQQGEWKPGEAIPSETELAARFGVSQGTVRKAIDELAAGNLLVRRQGRGTFVASHQEVRTQFRFLRIRPDEPAGDGAPTAMPTTSRFLDCRRLRAPVEVARQLQLRTAEPVVQIRRLLEVDARPTVLDEIWLPGARFRGLSAERLSSYSGPLYGLFEAEFGTRMIRATERLKAIAADAAVAHELDVAEGSPLLLVERLTYTYEDVPVELRRGYSVTTHHHYFNELI
ncbi:MAG: GntR family transcriptional regulator [Burkholderiaceae bacterium]